MAGNCPINRAGLVQYDAVTLRLSVPPESAAFKAAFFGIVRFATDVPYRLNHTVPGDDSCPMMDYPAQSGLSTSRRQAPKPKFSTELVGNADPAYSGVNRTLSTVPSTNVRLYN